MFRTKRHLLVLLSWLLYPAVCLSCGENGRDVVTAIIVDPSTPELGRPVELRCSISQSSLGLAQRNGSKLTWNERGGTKRTAEIYNRTTGEAFLRISNFSIADYGVYTCHCVNEYTFLQYETCGGHEGLPTHCSTPLEVELLPSSDQFMGVRNEFVSTPGETVSLGECTGGWSHIDSSGLIEDIASELVTVNTPQDQGKFICASSNSLHRIVYISIKDYQPLQILYPTTDTATLARFGGLVPMCATITSLTNITTTTLNIISNDMSLEWDANNGLNTDNEQCGWVTVHSVFQNVLDAAARLFNGSSFRCVVSNHWETLSINFTVAGELSILKPCPKTTSISAPTSSQDSKSSTATSSSPAISSSLAPRSSPAATPTTVPAPAVMAFQSSTPQPPPKDGNSSAGIIAGAAVVGGLVIFVVVTVICVVVIKCRRRKSRPRHMYKLPEDNMFVPESNGGFPPQPSLIDTHTSSLHPSGALSNTAQLFTHNGVPISQQLAKCISSLQQSPWLFPYEKLEFLEELGSGAFGVVKKALAHSLQPEEPATVVAVKMLKDDAASDKQEEKDIISELKVLQHVGAHPNIVCLLGASVSNGMLYVIVEYCSNGNLLNHLRSKRNDQLSPLTARGCVDMAAQVATGMEFLTSKDCIHRDLAARNVLITEDFVLKVADFGLARKMYDEVYRPSGGKVPVKWLAPESIIDQIYTAQSDVWSFGIVLWEILTLGRAPYPGKSAETMLRDLEGGYRMPRPPSCPVQIYDVMLKCWQWDSTNRPTFSELVKLLEEILTTDEPALNRHYYNMDISSNSQDFSVDSTLCSSEDLDSSAAARQYSCHSCGNTFTTTRTISSNTAKIFCDDCSQMPEYLSRSSLDLLSTCDDSATLGRRARWSHKIHSNDSGVKVSSEGTTEYYQVTAGPRATAFAKKLAESLQSMCSECKAELEPMLEVDCLWDKSSNQSLSSMCTDCKANLEGHKYTNVSPTAVEYGSREREEYMQKRKEKLLASSIHPTNIEEDAPLHSTGDRRGEEGEHSALHLENGFGEDTQKVELRQKFSNDSGIKMMSEPVYLKRASAPPTSMNAPVTNGRVLSPLPPQLVFSPQQISGCSTPGRLSAHPRNRDMFDELGIEETDL